MYEKQKDLRKLVMVKVSQTGKIYAGTELCTQVRSTCNYAMCGMFRYYSGASHHRPKTKPSVDIL